MIELLISNQRIHALAALLFAAALLGASGCGDSVDAPDGATQIMDLAPVLSDDGSTFEFSYLIMDPEGDDKRLRFEVCEAGGGDALEACGEPIQGPGGDGTDFVPTLPAGEFVEHVFRWDLGCGRFVGTERKSVEAATEYVGRVYIGAKEQAAATSEPFDIPSDALTADTDCTPPE
jgi:hypothetical protein